MLRARANLESHTKDPVSQASLRRSSILEADKELAMVSQASLRRSSILEAEKELAMVSQAYTVTDNTPRNMFVYKTTWTHFMTKSSI